MAKLPMNQRPILAQNIISRRNSKGWTQPDLAHKVGVHPNIIKRIESGKGEGELATREAIAGALECSLSDLYFDPSQADLRSFAHAAAFLAKFASVPRRIQRLVLAIMYKDETRLAGLPAEFQRLAIKILKAAESL